MPVFNTSRKLFYSNPKHETKTIRNCNTSTSATINYSPRLFVSYKFLKGWFKVKNHFSFAIFQTSKLNFEWYIAIRKTQFSSFGHSYFLTCQYIHHTPFLNLFIIVQHIQKLESHILWTVKYIQKPRFSCNFKRSICN